MSTKAVVYLPEQDGTYKGVFVNYDGYVSYTGMILKNSYMNEDAQTELLKFEDILQLKEDSKTIEPFVVKMGLSKYENFDDIAYRLKHGSFPDDGEYVYVFDGEKWMYSAYNYLHKNFVDRWTSLTDY